MSAQRELATYMMMRYMQAHPAATDAVQTRLAQLDAGAYVPANDPQAGPVIQDAITYLQGLQGTTIPNLIAALQTLATQSTPVL